MDKIVHDIDRDFYLNPVQAMEYGLVDEILGKPINKETKKRKKKS
jgi:ATP-dependent Clp protease protease subunit